MDISSPIYIFCYLFPPMIWSKKRIMSNCMRWGVWFTRHTLRSFLKSLEQSSFFFKKLRTTKLRWKLLYSHLKMRVTVGISLPWIWKGDPQLPRFIFTSKFTYRYFRLQVSEKRSGCWIQAQLSLVCQFLELVLGWV